MSRAQVIWIAAILLAGGFAQAAADDVQEIGWVLEYSPPEAVHKIRRANVSVPLDVKLGTPLRAGDVVSVDKNGRVLIALADGSEREVSGSGAWSVPVTKPRPGLWRVMQSMLGLVEREGALASSAVTKGGCLFSNQSQPIAAPVLSRAQKVVEGSQTLKIAWRGGCPPFSVTVEARGRVVASAKNVEKYVASLPQTSLKTGPHVLRIREARGSELKAAFEVVSASLPMPEDLAASSSTTAALAQATWLADQEEGAWRLESVKRLEPLVAGQQPMAVQLSRALLGGLEQDRVKAE
jgi:hypothetical protein